MHGQITFGSSYFSNKKTLPLHADNGCPYTFLTVKPFITLTSWKYKTTVALNITLRIGRKRWKSVLHSRVEHNLRATFSLLGWSKKYD